MPVALIKPLLCARCCAGLRCDEASDMTASRRQGGDAITDIRSHSLERPGEGVDHRLPSALVQPEALRHGRILWEGAAAPQLGLLEAMPVAAATHWTLSQILLSLTGLLSCQREEAEPKKAGRGEDRETQALFPATPGFSCSETHASRWKDIVVRVPGPAGASQPGPSHPLGGAP